MVRNSNEPSVRGVFGLLKVVGTYTGDTCDWDYYGNWSLGEKKIYFVSL